MMVRTLKHSVSEALQMELFYFFIDIISSVNDTNTRQTQIFGRFGPQRLCQLLFFSLLVFVFSLPVQIRVRQSTGSRERLERNTHAHTQFMETSKFAARPEHGYIDRFVDMMLSSFNQTLQFKWSKRYTERVNDHNDWRLRCFIG